MTSLVLAVDPPLPPTSGARLRTLHLARAVAAATDVSVAALSSPGDPVWPGAVDEPFEALVAGPPRSKAEALVRSLTMPYQQAKLNPPAVARIVAAPKWAVVQSPVFLLPSAVGGGRPVLLDAYDVESATARSFVDAEASPIARSRWRWEASKTAAFERRWLAAATATCATSDEDAAALERLGAPDVHLVPNGVDTSPGGIPHRLPSPGASIVFVGAFDYRPNVDAAEELVAEVLPRLRAIVPDARLTLVGRSGAAVRRLAGPGVTVVEDAPDVVTHLHEARVLVAPLRSGSGTRLKVLEAMAAGVPVVATGFGVAGLGLEHGRHALVVDDAAGLAAAAASVIADDGLATGLSTAARALVVERFDWSVVARPLVELHLRLGSVRS